MPLSGVLIRLALLAALAAPAARAEEPPPATPDEIAAGRALMIDHYSSTPLCIDLFGPPPPSLAAARAAAATEVVARSGPAAWAREREAARHLARGFLTIDPPTWLCARILSDLARDGVETGLAGPSFSCSPPRGRVRQAICRAPEIWPYDLAIARIMADRRAGLSGADRRALEADHDDWLARRDACGSKADCLLSRHEFRLYRLTGGRI